MRKFKITALLLAAVLTLTPTFGCKDKNNTSSESSSASNYDAVNNYADNPEIGKDKIEVQAGEEAKHNSTAYKLNNVIDSGKVQDGLKYIYLDVTIKNESDKAYETSGLNNFYLSLSDGTEITTDVRADLYAKQHITGYEKLMSLPAGGEFTGYIGFCIDENISEFTVNFFPTGDTDDRSSVVKTDIKADDIIPAPEGMIY